MYDAGMSKAVALDVARAAAVAAAASSGLRMLILYGSRARGDAGPGADWDFGYLAEEASDVPGLLAALVEHLGDDDIDLVDLDRASGLLRFRSACDGVLSYESEPGVFDRYRLEAAGFWCENSTVFERGYAATLEAL